MLIRDDKRCALSNILHPPAVQPFCFNFKLKSNLAHLVGLFQAFDEFLCEAQVE